MKQNNFHGLVIYQPSGKAAEYSLWACNLYNGCTHGCSYCFNNYPITSSVLGGTTVRLKKSLGDAKAAEQFFLKELYSRMAFPARFSQSGQIGLTTIIQRFREP